MNSYQISILTFYLNLYGCMSSEYFTNLTCVIFYYNLDNAVVIYYCVLFLDAITYNIINQVKILVFFNNRVAQKYDPNWIWWLSLDALLKKLSWDVNISRYDDSSLPMFLKFTSPEYSEIYVRVQNTLCILYHYLRDKIITANKQINNKDAI